MKIILNEKEIFYVLEEYNKLKNLKNTIIDSINYGIITKDKKQLIKLLKEIKEQILNINSFMQNKSKIKDNTILGFEGNFETKEFEVTKTKEKANDRILKILNLKDLYKKTIQEVLNNEM